MSEHGVPVDVLKKWVPILGQVTVAEGKGEHPKVHVFHEAEVGRNGITIIPSQIHMDHANVGHFIPCLKLDESEMMSMVQSARKLDSTSLVDRAMLRRFQFSRASSLRIHTSA